MFFDKIALGIAGLALVLNIIGVALPYWFHFSLTVQGIKGSVNFGLWKTCGSQPTESGAVASICFNFDNLEGFTVRK